MPQSQMAYDVSAAPLRRIFLPFLAMIVQFYGAGKTAAAMIAAAVATADRRVRVWGGEVVRVWCQPGAGILQCLCDSCKILWPLWGGKVR